MRVTYITLTEKAYKLRPAFKSISKEMLSTFSIYWFAIELIWEVFMKVVLFNGSPDQNGNTAAILNSIVKKPHWFLYTVNLYKATAVRHDRYLLLKHCNCSTKALRFSLCVNVIRFLCSISILCNGHIHQFLTNPCFS